MKDKHKHTGTILGAAVIVMLGLSYASVPLYRMFCQKTGYGGTTQIAKSLPNQAGKRVITVRFNSDVNGDLPWRFVPQQKEMKVRVGQEGFALYKAINLSNKPIPGMSTYNVTPDKAGAYFNKVECFCFVEQTLKPHEKVDMPVLFFIDPDITKDPDLDDVDTITLSYTFFKYRDEKGKILREVSVPKGHHAAKYLTSTR